MSESSEVDKQKEEQEKGKYGRTPVKKGKRTGRPPVKAIDGTVLARLEGFSFRIEEEVKRQFEIVHSKLSTYKKKKGQSWNRQNTLRVILRRGLDDIPDEWLMEVVDGLLPITTKIQAGVVELDDQVKNFLKLLLQTYNNKKIAELETFRKVLQEKGSKLGFNEQSFVEALKKVVQLIGE